MEITPISSAPRTLKVRKSPATDASASKPKVVSKRKPKTLIKDPVVESVVPDLTPMIAAAAYFIAQQRNFAPGNELSDWLMAEQQVRGMHLMKS